MYYLLGPKHVIVLVLANVFFLRPEKFVLGLAIGGIGPNISSLCGLNQAVVLTPLQVENNNSRCTCAHPLMTKKKDYNYLLKWHKCVPGPYNFIAGNIHS